MQVWEEDLHDAVDRYHNLLEKLEAYPEWKDKMVEEVGRWFLMIHNNLAEGDAKRELFSKLVPFALRRTGRITSSDPFIIILRTRIITPCLSCRTAPVYQPHSTSHNAYRTHS